MSLVVSIFGLAVIVGTLIYNFSGEKINNSIGKAKSYLNENIVPEIDGLAKDDIRLLQDTVKNVEIKSRYRSALRKKTLEFKFDDYGDIMKVSIDGIAIYGGDRWINI